MKKILITIVLSLAVLFASDRVISHYFTKKIFSKTLSGERGGTVNYIISKNNFDLLVLGSSRAKHQINPALLTAISTNGYNAGVNGTGGIVYNYLLLQLLTEKGIKPETILLQADAYPYFTEEAGNFNIELSPMYPFLDESESLKKEIGKYTDYAEELKLLFHTYRFNGKPLNIGYNYLRRNTVFENNGYVGLDGELDTNHLQLNERATMPHQYSTKKLAALAGIVSTCAKHHIRLFLVFPPSYKNCLFTAPGNEVLIKYLNSQPGVAGILDFSDIRKIPTMQDANKWRDASHMNAAGGIIFSKLINDSLHSMLARTASGTNHTVIDQRFSGPGKSL